MALTLYYHPLASYCHKVMVALHELGIDAERQLVDLADAQQRAQLQALWPMVKFPVLRDHARGRDIPESSIIIEYLDRLGGVGRLIPSDPDAALEVRLWDRVFDNYVQTPMQEIVAATFSPVAPDTSVQQAVLAKAYAMLDAHFAGRQWAAGDAFSMADCAAAPALFYAATVHPLPPQCANLAAYFERLMARASVRRVLDEARPYFAMYPFASAIPERFRQG